MTTSLEIFYIGIAALIPIFLISKTKKDSYYLRKEISKISSSEEMSVRMINLVLLYKMRNEGQANRETFQGFIEYHLLNCQIKSCPLTIVFRTSVLSKHAPRDYFLNMERAYEEFIYNEYGRVLKYYPSTARLRIEYAEFLFSQVGRIHSALEMLHYCLSLKMSWADTISYFDLERRILVNASDSRENKAQGQGDSRAREITKEHSIERNLDIHISRVVGQLICFWSSVSPEMPEISKVYKAWIRVSELTHSLEKCWVKNDVFFSTKYYSLYKYGFYLRVCTGEHNKGIEMLMKSKEILKKNLKDKYQLAKIRKELDLGNHPQGIAIFQFYKVFIRLISRENGL